MVKDQQRTDVQDTTVRGEINGEKGDGGETGSRKQWNKKWRESKRRRQKEKVKGEDGKDTNEE
jgi:hypothetical protein